MRESCPLYPRDADDANASEGGENDTQNANLHECSDGLSTHLPRFAALLLFLEISRQ
jgi:hypothetical protein